MYDRVNWTLYPIEWNIANWIWLRSQFYLRSLRKWAIQLVGIEHYGYEIASMNRCAWNRLKRNLWRKTYINIAGKMTIKMTNEISDWIGFFFKKATNKFGGYGQFDFIHVTNKMENYFQIGTEFKIFSHFNY